MEVDIACATKGATPEIAALGDYLCKDAKEYLESRGYNRVVIFDYGDIKSSKKWIVLNANLINSYTIKAFATWGVESNRIGRGQEVEAGISDREVNRRMVKSIAKALIDQIPLDF